VQKSFVNVTRLVLWMRPK